VEIYFHSQNTSLWRGAELSKGTTLPFTFTFTSCTFCVFIYNAVINYDCFLNLSHAASLFIDRHLLFSYGLSSSQPTLLLLPTSPHMRSHILTTLGFEVVTLLTRDGSESNSCSTRSDESFTFALLIMYSFLLP